MGAGRRTGGAEQWEGGLGMQATTVPSLVSLPNPYILQSIINIKIFSNTYITRRQPCSAAQNYELCAPALL